MIIVSLHGINILLMDLISFTKSSTVQEEFYLRNQEMWFLDKTFKTWLNQNKKKVKNDVNAYSSKKHNPTI